MNSQIAWAAGIFDIKGNIRTRPARNDMPVIALYVMECYKDVIERFVDVVGYGYVFSKARDEDDRNNSYYWEVAKRSEVRRILDMFLPYLGHHNAHAALNILDNLECT